MKKKESFLIAFFYLFMGFSYFLALSIDIGFNPNPWAISLNYLLKALLTMPIWFIFFKQLDNQPLWIKVLIHFVTLPIFTWAWLTLYYPLCDYFRLFYVKDSRQIWDFYLSGLFYTIQFGIFHIYDYYSKMQSKDLVIAQQNQLRLESELIALKAQLNPHFLYNVFNTINASVPPKAEKTRNMIAQLSDLFRYQLNASKEEWVTVKDEIDFVTKYLDLEKERFGNRLKYEITIEEDLFSCLIPPLIIQPIVENAVKHGISPLITGGNVVISAFKDADNLLIRVSDTGIGIDKEAKNNVFTKGVGLFNTHQRLTKMYGKGLELLDNDPSGLIIQFSINLNPKTNAI